MSPSYHHHIFISSFYIWVLINPGRITRRTRPRSPPAEVHRWSMESRAQVADWSAEWSLSTTPLTEKPLGERLI